MMENIPAFVSPPQRIPLWLRPGLWLARRLAGKDLLLPRLLAWYPRSAISSAILEALIAHDEPGVDQRLLKLVRMAVSFTANCPFCMDMNAAGWEKWITPVELAALQGRALLEQVPSFTTGERLAVEYARLVTQTPLRIAPAFVENLRQQFNERQVVILATTAAQVNYWARLIQALGCPPEGFTPDFSLYLHPTPVKRSKLQDEVESPRK